MKYDPNKHHRQSIRLKGYDYTQAGAYFVTICAYQRQCLFGAIIDGQMRLNRYGEIVAETYQWLCQRYPYLSSDEWIVMPNHFHGIMVITDKSCRGVSRNAPTINNRRNAPTINAPTQTIQPNNTNTPKPKSLGRLIGAFKTVSTKQINILRDAPGTPIWQRNYYEHIIRNQDALAKIREYIVNNPLAWEIDQLHPNHPSKW